MVLGAMLIDREAIPAVLEVVSENDFYREQHRLIFRAAMRLWERADEVDVLTMAEALKNTYELEAAGGWNYLSGLIDAVPTAANVEYHARIVSEKAELRSLVESCSLTIRDVYEPGERTVSEILSQAENRLLGVARHRGGYQPVKHILWGAFEALERLQEREEGSVPGIPTGLTVLDKKILGLHPGHLTLFAARPSMGKSAAAIGASLVATVDHRVPTLMFTFEMSANEYIQRSLSWLGMVDLQALRGGRSLTREEHQRIAAAAGHLNTAPLFIDDQSEPHIHAVAARARRAKKADNIGLIVIDYVQLMEGDGDNRTQSMDHVTRSLKRLARKLEIPILLLSQLSRGPENRSDKRPMLSDLRESGGIEQDADDVVFIYRPSYYLPPEEQRNLDEDYAFFIIAKQRNGPTGQVKVRFRRECARFEDLTGGPEADYQP